MLSYRHGFHAGNHADTLKHIVLLMLANSMLRKAPPICYLDTHAGAGGYELEGGPSIKTAEFLTGIDKLWGLRDLPAEAEDYRSAVAAFNHDTKLRRYPGSPWLVRHLLREHDRMVLCELHPTEIPLLRATFRGDPRVHIHQQDGFQGLKAFVPPKEKRLLALIDPPYEQDREYRLATDALQAAYRRWPTGVYALWYPVLERRDTEGFMKGLRATGVRKMLRAELCVREDRGPRGMRGSGMVVVNPPWQLDVRLETLLPWLWNALSPEGGGGTRVEWLVQE